MSQTWPPKTPLLTVDAIISIGDGIVLISRKYPPYGWALPGGFVEVGERVEDAVRREAFEETGLLIANLLPVGVYSDPERDARFHTVSIAFSATADDAPFGADDAAEARVFQLSNLPEKICFDHRQIIEDWRARRTGGETIVAR